MNRGLFPCYYNIKDLPQTKEELDASARPRTAATEAVAALADKTVSKPVGAGVEKKPPLSSLDPNHTHFVLVDNPDKAGGYGGEIKFRADLEKKISGSGKRHLTGRLRNIMQLNLIIINIQQCLFLPEFVAVFTIASEV